MTPMVSPGFDSSDYAAGIEFSLYQGTMNQYPYTGIGLYTNIDGADLSGMTGLRFAYTGAGSRLRVILSSIAESGHYYIDFPAASDWTPFEITWEDLVQPSEAESVPFDPQYITGLEWIVQGSDGTTGDLQVDEIILLDSLKSGDGLYTQEIEYYPDYQELSVDFSNEISSADLNVPVTLMSTDSSDSGDTLSITGESWSIYGYELRIVFSDSEAVVFESMTEPAALISQATVFDSLGNSNPGFTEPWPVTIYDGNNETNGIYTEQVDFYPDYRELLLSFTNSISTYDKDFVVKAVDQDKSYPDTLFITGTSREAWDFDMVFTLTAVEADTLSSMVQPGVLIEPSVVYDSLGNSNPGVTSPLSVNVFTETTEYFGFNGIVYDDNEDFIEIFFSQDLQTYDPGSASIFIAHTTQSEYSINLSVSSVEIIESNSIRIPVSSGDADVIESWPDYESSLIADIPPDIAMNTSGELNPGADSASVDIAGMYDYYPEYEIFYDFAQNRLEFMFQENIKGVDSLIELEISARDYDEESDSLYKVNSLYLSEWDYDMTDSSGFTLPLSEVHSDSLDSWGGAGYEVVISSGTSNPVAYGSDREFFIEDIYIDFRTRNSGYLAHAQYFAPAGEVILSFKTGIGNIEKGSINFTSADYSLSNTAEYEVSSVDWEVSAVYDSVAVLLLDTAEAAMLNGMLDDALFVSFQSGSFLSVEGNELVSDSLEFVKVLDKHNLPDAFSGENIILTNALDSSGGIVYLHGIGEVYITSNDISEFEFTPVYRDSLQTAAGFVYDGITGIFMGEGRYNDFEEISRFPNGVVQALPLSVYQRPELKDPYLIITGDRRVFAGETGCITVQVGDSAAVYNASDDYIYEAGYDINGVELPPDRFTDVDSAESAVCFSPLVGDTGDYQIVIELEKDETVIDRITDTLSVEVINQKPVVSGAEFPDTIDQDDTLMGVVSLKGSYEESQIDFRITGETWAEASYSGVNDTVTEFIIEGVPGPDISGDIDLSYQITDAAQSITEGTFPLYVWDIDYPAELVITGFRKSYGAAEYSVIVKDDDQKDLTDVTITGRCVNLLDSSVVVRESNEMSCVLTFFPLFDGDYSVEIDALGSNGKELGVTDSFTVSGVSRVSVPGDTNWLMASVPGGKAGLDTVSALGKTEIVHWNESGRNKSIYKYYSTDESIHEMRNGAGYWIKASEGFTLSADRERNTAESNSLLSILGSDEHEYGWNQIASPYLYPSKVDYVLLTWNPETRDYDMVENGIMEPWKSYWVYSDKTTDVEVSREPAFEGDRVSKFRKTGFQSVSAWRFNIRLHSEEGADRNNFIGFNPEAEYGRDEFDMPEPPRFSGPSLFIRHPTWKNSSNGAMKCAADIRSGGIEDGEMFQIGVSGVSEDAGEAYFTIEGSVAKGIYLFIREPDGGLSEYLPGDRVVVENTSEGTQYFTILASADKRYIEKLPLKFSMNSPYPNPSRGVFRVRYTVPYVWNGAGEIQDVSERVSAEIFDIRGRLVSTLYKGYKKPGSYLLKWDPSSSKGISSGAYFVRIRAAGNHDVKELLIVR